MDKIIVVGLGFILGTLIVFGISLLMAYPTMWLVNYLFTPALIASVFGAPSLGLAKAFWFNWFVGIVFKSSGSASSSKK